MLVSRSVLFNETVRPSWLSAILAGPILLDCSNGDEFQNPIDRDFSDPAVLQQFLESAVSSCAPTWSQAFTLAVSGTFTHAAVAGLLSGEVTLATMVGLNGGDAGLNLMGFGDVNILGVTLVEARLLFDLRDPLQPKIAAAVEARPVDNIGFNPTAFLEGNPFLVTNDFLQEFLAAIPVALDAVRVETSGSIEQMRERIDLPAIDPTGEFPQVLLDLLSPLSLFVPRREDGTPMVTDGETFTIGGGPQTKTFEFDDNGDVAAGRIAIPFGPANNVAAVAASIASAVAAAGLGITATAANGPVKLTGAIQQATIEIAGTSVSLLDGPDEIARDALLAFMGVMRDASHDAIEKASSVLKDDSLFDPSLTIVGEISPTILGIPLGKPPLEAELILNKRGLAFGMDFSVVKTLNTLGAAASDPLAGTVTSLLNLLPAPFSDRLFADVRFPFADDSGQMVDSLIALLDGKLPLDAAGNPLIIDPLSDNWAAVFRGTFNVFEIPLSNLGGMIFPPNSPHLLDARIQKGYDDPEDDDAVPDTLENLNCTDPNEDGCTLFTLDPDKFQVTDKGFFDGMES